MRVRRLVVPSTAAMVLVAAGCGSDTATVDDGADTVPPTSTTVATVDAPDEAGTPATTGATPTTTDATPTTATPTTTAGSTTGATPTTAGATPTTANTTPTTTADSTPSTTVPAGCVRIDGFETDDATWVIVNDGVMGGRSDGRFVIEDSLLRFSGNVVTAGGGFTSVRLPLGGDDLAGAVRVELRLRDDGRGYGLTFEDDAEIQGRPVAHGADLRPGGQADADGFRVVTVSFDDLDPSVFGRPVDAAPFEPDSARELGIIIADGVDGPFALDVDWIDACR